MSLAPGTRLGPYEIQSALGAGGMGEVYRARDARLQRDVAIKVLPAHLNSDPSIVARLKREAQAVASLSHPNILAVHDFGVEDETAYAVMELLEGETLRARLDEGALPVRAAIDYGMQIARGLAAAHDKNIIHRDVKPENLFVMRDGRVKILDFGLARATTLAGGSFSETTRRDTEPGTVLGTVGYMSPEQVRGEPCDHRSDLFSFGAVLYEMLTGQRAFARETMAETMTAILREEPPDLALQPRPVPPLLHGIIRHCLEKRPEARFRSAHDLAFALETLSGAPSSVALGTAAIVPARRSTRSILAGAAVAAVLAALAAGYGLGWRSTGRGARASEPPVFRQVSFDQGVITGARLAPDGQTIVYSTAIEGQPARVIMTRVESPGSRRVMFADASLLSVSPTAELALGLGMRFRQSVPVPGTLAQVQLLGGAPRPMLEGVSFADWSPTGAGLAIVRTEGSRQRLEFPPGKVLYETGGEIGWPRFSPSGDRIAFLDWPVKNDDRGSVAVIELAGASAPRPISGTWEALSGLAWAPDGREVWYTASREGEQYALHSTTLDGKERLLVRIPDGLVLQDIGKDGKLLAARYERDMRILGSFDGGSRERDLSWLGKSGACDVTRDGRRILLTHSGAGSGADYEVYVRRVEEDSAIPIGDGQAQQFSPDGSSVLSIAHGPPVRVLVLPIGSGQQRTVETGNLTVTAARWLPDGKRLVFLGTEPGHGERAYLSDVSGAAPRPITPEHVTYEFGSVPVSPDGERLALRAPDGAMTVYSTSGSDPIRVPRIAPSEVAVGWHADGRRLLIAQSRETAGPGRRIDLVDAMSGRREPWKTIRSSDPTLTGPSQVFVTPDGRSCVGNYSRVQMTLFLIEGVR